MLCSLTDGNLSRQIQTLQEAGFVEVWKSVQKKRPQTLCRLTDDGRRRFIEYVAELENVVRDVASTSKGSDQKLAAQSFLKGFLST